jgi:7-alpha-hydroxysteroid dehydrogenase
MAPLVPSLQGKVAIVTGGGRAIGRATAIALAQEGADVAIIARTAHELHETARLIESLGRRALTQSGDVRKSSDILRVK